MFDFIKKNLQKIYNSVTTSLLSIFSAQEISKESLEQIERILITADTGITTTKKIIASLQTQYANGSITQGQQLQQALEKELLSILQSNQKDQPIEQNSIFLLVGINGSGKTTFAGKLAYSFTKQGKRCILAAADTFRAAAPEQLKRWAESSKSELFMGQPNQDPAAIAYGACETFKQNNGDILIIDTAGRLQTKENLMREITKIKKVIEKQLPNRKIHTLLTVDAMLGQNSFNQAQVFNEAVSIDGIVLTKIDGTGKGGIIFSITQQLGIPVEYISYGEQIGDLKNFNAQEYVTDLIGSLRDIEEDK
ncbi:signal recognition particle-docking protein FtsY [Candidatus Babeliales bacterium]|nr:signal recognition particle-docking protein FtsY [Candidatus Babeliales bacterium]MBP9844088.1 signal recognition particle-docking protein FtsY [Candidatus Babeliales bacterium]